MFSIRIYDEAFVKSVLFKTYHANFTMNDSTGFLDWDTLSTMHSEQFTSRQKNPLVGVNRNVGSTSFYNPHLSNQQQYSFGVAHYFMRFNFTSAIYEKCYCHVHWIKFRATKFYRSCFMGHITGDDFFNGPRETIDINPYINVDDLIPSRFAMTFDKPNRVGFDISFISMDPERMGETTNDGLFMDVGNNTLTYKTTNTVDEISVELENFLINSDL